MAIWYPAPAGGRRAAAQAAWGVTLYVNNQVDCSDAQGMPYCTIGAAVAVANPGDTESDGLDRAAQAQARRDFLKKGASRR